MAYLTSIFGTFSEPSLKRHGKNSDVFQRIEHIQAFQKRSWQADLKAIILAATCCQDFCNIVKRISLMKTF